MDQNPNEMAYVRFNRVDRNIYRFNRNILSGLMEPEEIHKDHICDSLEAYRNGDVQKEVVGLHKPTEKRKDHICVSGWWQARGRDDTSMNAVGLWEPNSLCW